MNTKIIKTSLILLLMLMWPLYSFAGYSVNWGREKIVTQPSGKSTKDIEGDSQCFKVLVAQDPINSNIKYVLNFHRGPEHWIHILKDDDHNIYFQTGYADTNVDAGKIHWNHSYKIGLKANDGFQVSVSSDGRKISLLVDKKNCYVVTVPDDRDADGRLLAYTSDIDLGFKDHKYAFFPDGTTDATVQVGEISDLPGQYFVCITYYKKDSAETYYQVAIDDEEPFWTDQIGSGDFSKNRLIFSGDGNYFYIVTYVTTLSPAAYIIYQGYMYWEYELPSIGQLPYAITDKLNVNNCFIVRDASQSSGLAMFYSGDTNNCDFINDSGAAITQTQFPLADKSNTRLLGSANSNTILALNQIDTKYIWELGWNYNYFVSSKAQGDDQFSGESGTTEKLTGSNLGHYQAALSPDGTFALAFYSHELLDQTFSSNYSYRTITIKDDTTIKRGPWFI